jgi:hypothetical protein
MTTDDHKGRYACLYEGEQYIASGTAVCKNCGARIVYDPQGLDLAKIQHPNIKFELWCVGCFGATADLGDENMRHIRAFARAHPLLGPFADHYADAQLRRYLLSKGKQ